MYFPFKFINRKHDYSFSIRTKVIQLTLEVPFHTLLIVLVLSGVTTRVLMLGQNTDCTGWFEICALMLFHVFSTLPFGPFKHVQNVHYF